MAQLSRGKKKALRPPFPVAKKTYDCSSSGTWQFVSYDPGSCGRDGAGLSPHTTTDSGPWPIDAGMDADSSPCSDIVFPDVRVPDPARDAAAVD